MLDGRSGSERITASPRKMCVPGVQACATAGVSISASTTASARVPAEAARDVARPIDRALDPDTLALPTNGFAKVVQLFLYDIVDRAASGVDILTYLFDDIIHWDAVHQVFSALDRRAKTAFRPGRRPASTFSSASTCPTCAL